MAAIEAALESVLAALPVPLYMVIKNLSQEDHTEAAHGSSISSRLGRPASMNQATGVQC